MVTVLLAVAMFCLAAFSSVNVIYLMLGSIGISIVAVAVAHVWARKKFLMTVSAGTPVYTRKGIALDPGLNAARSSSEDVKSSEDNTSTECIDIEEDNALDPNADGVNEDEGVRKDA